MLSTKAWQCSLLRSSTPGWPYPRERWRDGDLRALLGMIPLSLSISIQLSILSTRTAYRHATTQPFRPSLCSAGAHRNSYAAFLIHGHKRLGVDGRSFVPRGISMHEVWKGNKPSSRKRLISRSGSWEAVPHKARNLKLCYNGDVPLLRAANPKDCTAITGKRGKEGETWLEIVCD